MDSAARSIGRNARRQGVGLTPVQAATLKAVINCLIDAGDPRHCNPTSLYDEDGDLNTDAWSLGKWEGLAKPEIETVGSKDRLMFDGDFMVLAVNSTGPDAAAVGRFLFDLLSEVL